MGKFEVEREDMKGAGKPISTGIIAGFLSNSEGSPRNVLDFKPFSSLT